MMLRCASRLESRVFHPRQSSILLVGNSLSTLRMVFPATIITLPVTPAGSCFLLVSSFFLSFFLSSLPCRWLRQGLVSYSLSCRRSRRILFSYPAGAAAGYCFLLVSYPAGDSGRVLFLTRFFFLSFFLSSFFLLSFFFLATRLFHILPYIRFWPNLVKVTGTLTTTQAQTMVGSEVTMGSLGSKRSFSPKRHQVLQNTWHWHGTYAYAVAWPPLQKLWS